MTTILEIQKPHLSYCKKYDIHCPCIKCTNPQHKAICMKFVYTKDNSFKPPLFSFYVQLTQFCNNCKGPNKDGEIEILIKNIHKTNITSVCPAKVNKNEYQKINKINDTTTLDLDFKAIEICHLK